MAKGPVEGTQIKNGRYYLVRADGPKRHWIGLTRVREGLPAFYTALAKELGRTDDPEAMPKVVSAWCDAVMVKHSAKTQVDERRRANVIAESFSDFRCSEVEPPDCMTFLEPLQAQARTHDLFRSQLHSIFKYAELKGWRKAGSNPVTAVPPMGYKPRERYITDSEMRRIKVGCVYGDDGKRTRSGLTTCCAIELAYLTAADAGVLVRILEERDPTQPDEPHLCPEGIALRRDKTKHKGGDWLIITWTPRLRAVVKRLQRLKAERKLKQRASQRVETRALLTQQDGTPLTYEALAASWQRGVKRAKVPATMFRDIRAKAITDKAVREGVRSASDLGIHATEAQTTSYVRRRKARKTSAAA
ncbi:MAG: hypothetical protein C0423_17220 [Methylibium sp.]|nr:hypothetical protein [Methylibium sp.]